MAKKKAASYMTPGEQIGGVVFLMIYLVVLPFATDPLFRFVGGLLDVSISATVQNMVYYYVLFAVTLVMFHKFIGRTSRNFADNLGVACRSMLVGLIGLYGLNELVYRLTRLAIDNRTNLNDTTISAQIQDAPRVTGTGVRQSEEQEPGGGVSGQLPAVRADPCVAVCGGAAGHHLFPADGAVSGARRRAGVGL